MEDALTARVTVAVVDPTKSPVEGAQVVLRAGDRAEPVGQGTSGLDGTVSFDDVPREGLSARATLRGYLSSGWVEPSGEDARGPSIRIELVPGTPLHGRVVDEKGLGISGATLMVSSAPFADFAVTDANGAFEIGGVPRERGIELSATADGYLPRSTPLSTGETDGIVVELRPAGMVTGVVLHPGGAPAKDAEVFLVNESVPSLLVDPTQGEPPMAYRGRAGRDGSFRLTGLTPGAGWRVLARTESGAMGGSTPLIVADHAPDAEANVVVLPRCTLLVRAVPWDGVARSRAAIISLEGLRSDYLGRSVQDSETLTAAPGQSAQFTGLVAGTVSVVAQIERSAPSQLDVEIPASGQVEVEVRGARGVELSGEVVDTRGRACRDVEVRFSISGGAGAWPQDAVTRTDGRGRFTFPHLQEVPGTLLSPGGADHASAHAEGVRPGGPSIRLVLPQAAVVRGRLVGSLGPGVALVELEAEDQGKRTARIQRPSARFEFRGLAPGRYRARTVPSEEQVATELGVLELSEGETREVEWFMP